MWIDAPDRNAVFFRYLYLQLLDILTTLAFLLHGVQEANPLVRLALAIFPNPVMALLAVKTLAVALGLYCWLARRTRVLAKINVLFAALIAWNLVALIVGALRTAP